MDFDTRELCRDCSQICIEPRIFTFVAPGRCDFAGRIAKDGAKSIVQSNRVAEFFFDRVAPDLRCIGPNAQYVREIGNLDNGHRIGPLPPQHAGFGGEDISRCSRMRGAANFGSRISAANRKKRETDDEQNDQKQADAAEAAHPAAHAPSPSPAFAAAHHPARTWPLGLRVRGKIPGAKRQRSEDEPSANAVKTNNAGLNVLIIVMISR